MTVKRNMAALAASVLVVALWACEEPGPDRMVDPKPQASKVDPKLQATLPQADLAKLRQLIDESRGKGQVVVLDFWATWCAPCVEMFPRLHEAVAPMGSKVRLVSVTLDTPGDSERRAIEFVSRHGAEHDAYLLVPDVDQRLSVPGALGKKWRDLVVPAVLVFGPDGQLAGEFLGETPLEQIVAKISELTPPGTGSARAISASIEN